MKKLDEQIVSGSILRSVWKLTWPVALLNLVNGSHGFVDQILIGRHVPSETNAANAAIGISWQVFLVIIVFIASIFHGMNVLIARYAGIQDRENMSRVAYESFLFTVLTLVFIVGPIGYAASPYLLDYVCGSQEVWDYAIVYIRMLFLFGAPLFLMFMLTGAFGASGDPKTPLKLGILSTSLNIVLSLILIPGVQPFDIPLWPEALGGAVLVDMPLLGAINVPLYAAAHSLHVPLHIPALGVMGAAIGTLVAPAVSVLLAIILILRHKMILQPPKKFTIIPDFKTIWNIARIGIPTGIQGVLLNIGGTCVILYLAQLEDGDAAQAAYTICYTQLFSIVTRPSFGLRGAAATVMGQNIGAGKQDRGKKGVAVAACLGLGWAFFAAMLYWFQSTALLGMFGATEEPVFSYGKELLHFLAFSAIVLSPTLALTGGIQGAGETKKPMYIAFLTQIVVLLGIVSCFFFLGSLTTTTVWSAILISHISRLVLTIGLFRTKQWQHTEVRMND